MKKHKFIMLILFLVLVLIIGNVIQVIVYRKHAEKNINNYILMQGLSKEEILDDTGVVDYFYNPYFRREIVFKNNPKEKYIYEISSGIVYGIKSITPFYNYDKFKDDETGYTNDYKGVFFTIEKIDDSNIEEDNEIYDGKLDKDGNLLKDIPWLNY